jgi:hypothetical protein
MHPHFRSFASRDEGAGTVAALEQDPVTIRYVVVLHRDNPGEMVSRLMRVRQRPNCDCERVGALERSPPSAARGRVWWRGF